MITTIASGEEIVAANVAQIASDATGDGTPSDIVTVLRDPFADLFQRAEAAGESIDFGFEVGLDVGVALGYASGTLPPPRAQQAIRDRIKTLADRPPNDEQINRPLCEQAQEINVPEFDPADRDFHGSLQRMATVLKWHAFRFHLYAEALQELKQDEIPADVTRRVLSELAKDLRDFENDSRAEEFASNICMLIKFEFGELKIAENGDFVEIDENGVTIDA